MVKCCAPLCGNASYRKLPDITFHRFPKDVNLKNAWLAKTGRKNWQPKPSSVLCSNHFEAHLVDHSGFRSVLAPGAVPTIFDLSFQDERFPICSESDGNLKVEVSSTCATTDPVMEHDTYTNEPSTSSKSIVINVPQEYTAPRQITPHDDSTIDADSDDSSADVTIPKVTRTVEQRRPSQTVKTQTKRTRTTDSLLRDVLLQPPRDSTLEDVFEGSVIAPTETTQLITPFTWEKSNAPVPCDTDILEDIKPETQTGQDESHWNPKESRQPTVATLTAKYCCNICEEAIKGCRYTCVECPDFDLCVMCEAGGHHQEHYVLRVPIHKTLDEVQMIKQGIRQALSNAIVQVTADYSDDIDIKEEDIEDPIGLDVIDLEVPVPPVEDPCAGSDSELQSEIVTHERKTNTWTHESSQPTMASFQNVFYRKTRDSVSKPSNRQVITFTSDIPREADETEATSKIRVTSEPIKSVFVPVPHQQIDLLSSILDKDKVLPQRSEHGVSAGKESWEPEAFYIQKQNETPSTSDSCSTERREILIPARSVPDKAQTQRILEMTPLPDNFKKRVKVMHIQPLSRAQPPSTTVVPSNPPTTVAIKEATVQLQKMSDHDIIAILDKNKTN